MEPSRTGQILKSARELQGKSVRDIARLAGLAPSTVLRAEAGEIVRSDTLAALASVLDLPREQRAEIMGWRR